MAQDNGPKDGGKTLFLKGDEADKSGQRDQAIEYYKQSAAQGNAQAQGQLSIFYYSDNGHGSDYEKAVEWSAKAAAQGEQAGEYILALCYLGGHGAAEDDAKGLDLLRKSANQGWFQAQNDLGAGYEQGLWGLPKDLGQAKYWYQLSAAQGYAGAKLALSNLGDAGASAGGNASNNPPAHNDAGSNVSAEEALKNGDYYGQSDTDHFDINQQRDWYLYAAKMGSADAQYKLGLWYDAECNPLLNAPQNPQYDCAQAVYWFQLAANQGNSAAADEAQKYHSSGW
jgi:TPR repeat protein